MTDSAADDLRDRFFSLRPGPDPEESLVDRRARFFAELAAAPEPLVLPATTRLQGLELCHGPSARFRQLRFIDAAHIDATVRDRFARPSHSLPELAAVFVDPQELSYRNFESIVCLDRRFPSKQVGARVRSGKSLLGQGTRSMTLEAAPGLAAFLQELDGLDLYLPPSNAASRGGRRFIFHCTGLAASLTATLSKTMSAAMRRGFVTVNPVFRCNRFDPGDDRFLA
ncbi:MAG: hypothetical protein KC457_02585, partial [Myxococcales bacterium]|nr:hypothetical protein [Myxococcales bacterium]